MNINLSLMKQLATAPLDTLSNDWTEEFEERAAILEYDGGLDRFSAEKQAYREILQRVEALTNSYAD
jgi:hypothetical protein